MPSVWRALQSDLPEPAAHRHARRLTRGQRDPQIDPAQHGARAEPRAPGLGIPVRGVVPVQRLAQLRHELGGAWGRVRGGAQPAHGARHQLER